MTDLFIFAAEPSADLHGEKLLKALFEKKPSLKVIGVGGPKMRAQGLHCVMPMENFQVMGFIDVITHLPQLIAHFYKIRSLILKTRPKCVLFIDYPGFNLRMETHLRKKGYKGKLIHYICPSVWAWGKKRIFTLEKNLDLLLSILPFEKSLFDTSKLTVEYVGNPLVSRIKDYTYKPFLFFPKDTQAIAIFPGSRRKEIERNLSLHLDVLKKFPQYLIAISVSHPAYLPLIEDLIQKAHLSVGKEVVLIPADFTYELMKAVPLAIAKSGTVTLELGLHETPTIVTYAISSLDMLAVKYIFKPTLRFYSLVNILLNKEVYPELMGPHFTYESLFNMVNYFLSNPKALENCKIECKNLHTLLLNKDASQEVANLLLKTLK